MTLSVTLKTDKGAAMDSDSFGDRTIRALKVCCEEVQAQGLCHDACVGIGWCYNAWEAWRSMAASVVRAKERKQAETRE